MLSARFDVRARLRPEVGPLNYSLRALLCLLLIAGTVVVPFVATTNAKADTLQMSSDSSRTGWYPDEPQLSPANVTSGSFGQIFDTQLNGQVVAQPLVSQSTLLAVTETNHAYGLNATTGAIEWQDSFAAPQQPLLDINCGDVGTNLGITGTPVVDPATDIAYFVTAQQEPGNTGGDFLQAVNVATGAAPSNWPAGGVAIQGSADGDPSTVFNATYQTQRAGLVLVNGVVYAAFGSECDLGNWNGWLVGISVTTATPAITTMWASEENTTITGPLQPGGGIWQSSSAPVVDANGNIFVATGNGFILSNPEPGTDLTNQIFGEAVVKLHTNSSGQLAPVDWFMAADASGLNSGDGDLGSGGPVALPASMGTSDDPNPMVISGKQGMMYVLKMNNLGGYQQGSGGTDAIESETGPYGSVWSHVGVWPGDGGYIYLPTASSTPFTQIGSGGSLEVFQRTDTNGVLSFPLVAKTSNSGLMFGFGSSAPVVTSNGTTTGSALVWIVHSPALGGANAQLEAFNPLPVNPGANGTLEQVWSSGFFTASTFSQPAVDNGIVYVGTKNGSVLSFGALPSSTPSLTGTNLSFPPTVVAQTSTLNETFTASAPTTVSSFAVAGAAYSVGTPVPPLPASLAAGQTITVPVTFTPTAFGDNQGILTTNATGETASVTLYGDGTSTNPTLSWTPDAVAFVPQPINGPPVTMPVTVTNVSSSSVTVSNLATPVPPFTLLNPPTLPLVLAPAGQANDSFTFDVQFAPPSSSGDFQHDFNSSVTIVTNLGNFGIAISGSADPPAQITTTPNTLNFGSVAVGSSSTLSFELGNKGGLPLTITQSTPPTTNGFSALTDPFTQLANNSPPDSIAPASSVQETVQFAPTANGSVSGSWLIEGNDGSGVQTITITGTGFTASTTTTAAVPPPPPPPPASTTTTSTTTTTTTTIPKIPATTTTTIRLPTLTLISRAGRVGSPLTLRVSGDHGGGSLTFRLHKGSTSACMLRGSVLRAKRPGTCLVSATKAPRGSNPSVTSATVAVTFTTSPHSPTLTSVILFSASNSTLTVAAKTALDAFAKRIAIGSALVVAGYAPGNAALARHRAIVVIDYLKRRVKVRVTLKTVTATTLGEVSLRRD